MAAPFIDTARITVKVGQRRQRCGRLPPGEVCGRRRPRRRRWRPGRQRRPAGGRPYVHPDGLPLQAQICGGKRRWTGSGKRCSGKDGQRSGDPKVPRGTVIRDAETGEIIWDMSADRALHPGQGGQRRLGQQALRHPHPAGAPLCQGGPARPEPGGRVGAEAAGRRGAGGLPQCGQVHPAERGHPGPAQDRQLPLHHPVPQPGRGVCGGRACPSSWPTSPASSKGPAEGAGLGHDFLRHIDRCRLLIHVVDVSGSEGRDPVADFEAINEELEQYSPELASRPMLVAANKVDIMEDPALLEQLRAHVAESGHARCLRCPPPPTRAPGS